MFRSLDLLKDELFTSGAVFYCKFCQGLSATAKADTDVSTLTGFLFP